MNDAEVAKLLVPLFLMTTGCFLWPDPDPPPIARDPVPAAVPPLIESVEIPEWPPLGPNGQVRVTASDDEAVTSIRFGFLHEVERYVSNPGSLVTVTVTGGDLGEGLGQLEIQVFDNVGAHATGWVDDLLVDLSPPEIFLGETLLRPDEDIELWVADAWVLGSVTLVMDGVVQEHSFEPGYPPTLGEAWDQSLVQLALPSLVQGSHTGMLYAADAAGNQISRDITIQVDGIAPDLTILSPSAGAVVSGPFTVEILANDPDPEGGPVWVDVRLGGTPVALASGPTVMLEIDADAFAAGPLELEAVAVDEAGNESDPATLPLIIQ